MSKDQRGFTYPLTLAILISFLIFFSFQVEQLLTEKKMFQETKMIWQEEYYMLLSVKKIEGQIEAGETIATKGTFHYLKGFVNFQVDPPTESIQKITFMLELNTGETAVGFGYYDLDIKKLTKWLEKN